MESKNYVIRENDVQRAYYCQLQVSNKFRKTMSPQEAELVEWITDSFVHHVALTLQEQESVAASIRVRVNILNGEHENNGPFLAVTCVPLRKRDNGFIRIERTSGRHQSILLPIIDYRGTVNLEGK